MPSKPGSRQRKYTYAPSQRGNKMQGRVRSRNEYHTYRWTKASRRFREANPFCAACLQNGLMVATQVTNHIIPNDLHPDFWAVNNREPLCTPCNIKQGNTDKQLIAHVRAGKVSKQQLETMRANRVAQIEEVYKQNDLTFRQI